MPRAGIEVQRVEVVGEGLARLSKQPQLNSGVVMMRRLYDLIVYTPMNYLWLAAILGGVIAYCFRCRPVPQNLLPEIDRPQFIVLWLAVVFLIVLSAPILTAACFSGLELIYRYKLW